MILSLSLKLENSWENQNTESLFASKRDRTGFFIDFFQKKLKNKFYLDNEFPRSPDFDKTFSNKMRDYFQSLRVLQELQWRKLKIGFNYHYTFTYNAVKKLAKTSINKKIFQQHKISCLFCSEEILMKISDIKSEVFHNQLTFSSNSIPGKSIQKIKRSSSSKSDDD